LLLIEILEKKILLIRGHKVMLDRDLAELYGVTTGNLNKAVSRNIERFPNDFMLQLTKDEFADLKFHFGISSWGGTRKGPRAFTQEGIAMLSGVLKSERAVKVNIAIMRTFVKLREMLASNKELAKKLEDHERKLSSHDQAITGLIHAIRELAKPEPSGDKGKIGFTS
jgi:hypothetical protein